MKSYFNSVDCKNCEGLVFKSKKYGLFKIIKYKNRSDIEICFEETGYRTKCHLSDIRSGLVKDRWFPSVFGVGYIGDKYPTAYTNKDGKRIKVLQYSTWLALLGRCYSEEESRKYFSYRNCVASENFKSYEYFYEWCTSQIGFGREGFRLDKDLLVKGNKVYGENTCIFLPNEVNLALISRKDYRGDCPIGVIQKGKGVYEAAVRMGRGVRKVKGGFKTKEEAFIFYKSHKENFIHSLGEKYRNDIDPRAYEALIKYEVCIDD